MHFHVHDKAAQVKAIIQGMDYIKPHECAMIGDLPSDMLDSKRAGINGVAFLNKHVPRELFTNIEMDFAVIEFEGILPLCWNDSLFHTGPYARFLFVCSADTL